MLITVWVPDPVRPDEQLVLRRPANRTQGRRAVGGALFLTAGRLVFSPHRLDRLTGGRPWEADLTSVATVGVLPRTGGLTDGGLRDRLHVQLHDGGSELFVVKGLPQVVETVRAHLPTPS